MASERGRRDLGIAAVGAVAILLAAGILFVVEERAGPYDADLDPARLPVASEGRYESQPAQGGALPGVCDDSVPGNDCQDPHTLMVWSILGLPPAPEGTEYAVWLVGDQITPLAPMFRTGQLEAARFEADQHHADATALRFVLVTDWADTEAAHLALLERPVAAEGRTDLTATTQIVPPSAGGTARFEQIGAVEVSLLADIAVDGEPLPGTVHRAWLVRGDEAAYLGELEIQDGGALLDVRIERLRLADWDTVLVTLESGPLGEGPAGLPVHRGVL